MQETSAEATGQESAQKVASPHSPGSSDARGPDSSSQTKGQLKFHFDPVVHAHNYEDIRDIPTGGYLKSPVLQKVDPQDAIATMSKNQLDQKIKKSFKGIFQSKAFEEPIEADPTKLPKLFGDSGHPRSKRQSLDAKAGPVDKRGQRVTSLDAKIKLKNKGANNLGTLTAKDNLFHQMKHDPVMYQYQTAKMQIKENIARAQAAVASQVNSAGKIADRNNKTLNHITSHEFETQYVDNNTAISGEPQMLNKPSNLTSQQALGLGEVDRLPRGTTFSTLQATAGGPQEENATNASTFLGVNTLAGAKNTKYRAHFRLNQNSAITAKHFQRSTESKDGLDTERALNDTMELGSKVDLQNLPQGTLSHINSKSNQISQLTQAYGFNVARHPGAHLQQNAGSGPIPFVPRSGLGTPDRFGQTQAVYPQQSPLYDEMLDLNKSTMEHSHFARPHLMAAHPRRASPHSAINKVAGNINSVRDYKFQQFDAQQERIRRIHQKLMQKKAVSSGGNSSLDAIQKLLSQKMAKTFLATRGKHFDQEIILQNSQHNELFKDMNRLNGCFLDVVDNVCSYKVEMGIMLQRLVECYNSVFLQQYEVFYDGRLEKEKMLEKEIAVYQAKQKQTDEERDTLEQKQDLAEKAIQVKDNEIERLLEQQAHLEKTIEELKVIIRGDKKEEQELQEEQDKKQAELDGKEYMVKDYDRNKRIALKQNPMSAKLLLDPATIDDYEEVVEISMGRQEDRNAYVESLYEVIKSMLTNKQKHQKVQTDQACMNNAIMYDYYSYGDSSSEKGDTQDKNEEEDPNSQDAKLKRLMKEKGISIDEEDVDEGEPGTNKESEGKSEGGGLKVGESAPSAQRRKSGESTRSGKKRPGSKSKQSGQSARDSTQIHSAVGSRLSNRKRQSPGKKSEFNPLELPQTYQTQSLRQMGLRDEKKLRCLHDTLERICLRIKKKKQQHATEEFADTAKFNGEVVWKIPYKVIAFLQNRILQFEENPSMVENYELMPWHQLKEIIFDIYDHRVKHTPELCGSVNTNYCSLNEHLLMFFIDKYRKRQKAEEKIADLIINIRYYYDHWKRVQMYAANLEFATRVPAKAADGTAEKAQEKSKDSSENPRLTEHGDPVVFEPPHGYVKDDKVVEHDIYVQEFFLHAYSLLNHDRNNFLESREGKTYVRNKVHDQASKRIIPLIKGPCGDVQKWSMKMRRLVRKIKNKDGAEYDYLDLDLILDHLLEDFKQQRSLFQKDMMKGFARSVEAVSGALDLDTFNEIITTALPPVDDTQALEHPLISYPRQMSHVRAFIFACTSGIDNILQFSDACFVAGAARFGLESPVPSISTRCGFYGNSRDIMQVLQEAEQKFGKPVKVDAKQLTSFTMGLPEKKDFKKRSTSLSKQRNEPSGDEDVEMRRKRTVEANETQKVELGKKVIAAGLVNMKMEFVEDMRNQGRFSPLLGSVEHVKLGAYKCKVQSIRKKAARLEDQDEQTLKKSIEDAQQHAAINESTDQKVLGSQKFGLTDVQIGMKKEILVPSFRTTVDVFGQHFLILRELKHRIELLQQAYFAQMDKKKTWQQVNEIIQVLDVACTYLDFPDNKDVSKLLIRDRQEELKQQLMHSEQSPLTPKSMFLSSQLGAPKELGDIGGVKAGLNQPVTLIREEDEDEERNDNDGEDDEAPKRNRPGGAHAPELVVEDSAEQADDTHQDQP